MITSPICLLRLVCAVSLALGATTNGYAESASSTAASAGSASVGSLSDSLAGSSASSTRKVAAGDYEVIEVAAVPEREGMLRLQLKPRDHGRDQRAEADIITLTLPARALGERGITTGETIHVRQRIYGFEFARAAAAAAQTREVFFLALDNAWHRELDPRPVTL